LSEVRPEPISQPELLSQPESDAGLNVPLFLLG